MLDWAKLSQWEPGSDLEVTEERIGQALPTATGIGARLTIAVLKKHNVAPAPILGRAGLSEQDFDSRQRRISAASESKCLEYAAEAMDDSAFGLHLAEEANPRDAGMLFYIASAANNVGEALELFVRYSRIVNEAMRIKLIPAPEGAVAEITFVDHSRHSAKQVIEFASAIILKGVREVARRCSHRFGLADACGEPPIEGAQRRLCATDGHCSQPQQRCGSAAGSPRSGRKHFAPRDLVGRRQA